MGQVAPQPQQAITPEMVTQAYLFNADAGRQLESAYNAQSLGEEKTANAQYDKFISDANDNINELFQYPVLGYGPVKGRLLQFQIDTLGGGGDIDQDVVALNERYKLLKLNILRAFQGARISDADYELAQQYMPNLSDTNETAQTKLTILQNILTQAVPQEKTGSQTQSNQFQELFNQLGL